MRVAAVQLQSQDSVSANLIACEHWISAAASAGAHFVVLPENFAYFGSDTGRRAAAESLSGLAGTIRETLAQCADRYNVAILAGGWPEVSNDVDRPFNAATVYSSDGSVLTNYRKIHLFDVQLPSGEQLRESAAMSSGTEVITCDLLGFRVGLSICYDVRFPELFRKLVDRGSEILCVPSAFTQETGRDHWHILMRARAVESQCWVIGANQCGSHPNGKTTYGHSLIVDPWGKVRAEADNEPGLVVADIDADSIDRVRSSMPALRHRRIK